MPFKIDLEGNTSNVGSSPVAAR